MATYLSQIPVITASVKFPQQFQVSLPPTSPLPPEDGRLLYRFTAEGRHQHGGHPHQSRALQLRRQRRAAISITDADNNVTAIERDGNGNPTAIVAPFGQRTMLTVNSDGYLASVANPVGETHQLTYTADGLLTAFTDPKHGNAS